MENNSTFNIKNSKLAIIGLGYVGLPLAAEFAKTIGVLANAIKQHLANLQKENRFKSVGDRRSGH
jgi:UDP-N-acetyl-D-mannosaminuronate dehydrogenase